MASAAKIIKRSIQKICPFEGSKDHTDIEIVYVPGSYNISEDAVEKFIETEIEEKKIAIELIPLKILKFLVKTSLKQGGGRHAAPAMVNISSFSKGKTKGWSMNINLNFSRKVIE